MQGLSFSEQQMTLEWGALEESTFEALLAGFSTAKKAILVDENTHEHCLEFLITRFEALATAEVIVLPAGEENKNLEICIQVWETLTDAGFGRHDLLLNLGGGVVTDLGAFVASVFKRGFHFINIPTSLLAVVDAAVGGKTGIDFAGLKNQIGTFCYPLATFLDLRFLNSLPKVEWVNGYAELLKHALIQDAGLWKDLQSLRGIAHELHEDLIIRAVTIKQNIVLADPQEKGLRKILNFGHTIGHALESYYLNSETPLSHGHAVAIGMLVEAHLSWRLAGLPLAHYEQIQAHIKRFYTMQIPANTELIWGLMQQDKKNKEGEVRLSLLSEIGVCVYDQTVEFADFQWSYAHFLA